MSKRAAPFRSTLVLTCAIVAVLVGCTRPRQTTAIGSGVGGAIGAGLGAIVGNQSGNAGSGVAIGAAAGAATGALIGNALEAQEERITSTEEALKRQERKMQAQKNEIAELRAIRSDTSSSYDSYESTSTPRYRYRQPSVSEESPEVARQRARLQQRGPRPSGSSSMSDDYYEPVPTRRPVQYDVKPPTHDSKPLARYDVRSELHEKASVKKPAPVSTRAKVSEKPTPAKVTTSVKTPPAKKASLPEPASEGSNEEPNERASDSVAERDLPIANQAASKAVAPIAQTSSECKEALSERDRAAEAADNSDKLFHLRRALRLCPNSAPLHYELGRVYSSMDRGSDAESEFKQALSIDPSLAAAKKALGEMLKEEVQF
jgi:uncharacterized protein YcfJ